MYIYILYTHMHTHLHLYIQVNTELRPFASFVTPVAENGARGRSTKTSRCNCCDSCCGGFQVGGGRLGRFVRDGLDGITPDFPYAYGSIPINTIFRGMNIHLPAILMFTRGTRFWHTAIWFFESYLSISSVVFSIVFLCWQTLRQNPSIGKAKLESYCWEGWAHSCRFASRKGGGWLQRVLFFYMDPCRISVQSWTLWDVLPRTQYHLGAITSLGCIEATI